MKKFLSLVLALVMTMSLVTVSAGAVDFTDDSSIKYEEAVDVISATGVVGGYADGSFNPKGTLTRGAAAKIICNIMLGTKTAAALKASVAPFSDVPVDNVFSAYIAYCANEGLISGYPDGTFKPAATLTGFAFMKMLLGAIGYDQSIEGFTGTNWAINVAKLGVAKDLNKGIKGFDGTKYITREEAAQMTFKAMQATMVEYKDKSTVTIGDVVISNNSQAEDVKVAKDTLMKLNFEDLQDYTDADAYGRPATRWEFDGEVVGIYGDAADFTIVAAKQKTLTDLIEDAKLDKEIANYDDYDTTADTKYLGDVVEIYVNSKDNVTDIITYKYVIDQIDEIEEIDADLDEDAAADGAKYEVTFKNSGLTVYDIQLEGFDAKTYVEDAFIMFPEVAGAYASKLVDFEELGKELVYADTAVATGVDGKITAVTTDYIKVDGKKYPAQNGVSFTAGKEGTIFVDPNGFAIEFEAKKDETHDLSDIWYVANSYPVTDKDEYGTLVTTTKLQLVAANGDTQDIVVKKSGTNSGNALNDDPSVGDIITIKDGKKGLTKCTVLTKVNDDYKIGYVNASAMEADDTKVGDYRLNKDTTVVSIDGVKGDLETTVKVGGTEVVTGGTSATVIYKTVNSANKVAVCMFMAATVKGTSDEVLFVGADALDDAENVVVGEDDTDCISVEVIGLDGKTKTILIDSADKAALVANGNAFYTVDDIDDDNIYDLKKVTTGYVDDSATGVASGNFVSYYETLVTFGSFVDVETENAVFADIHSTSKYPKTVKSLAAMKTADKNGYTVSLMVYADEDDGAQLIVVTSVK